MTRPRTRRANQVPNTSLPAPARRRGSVIVLVVGVLAVVAISAVTYVNIVSLDRRAASAVQRRVNYQQQADAVMNHIRALIGADLFGDKITTNATPMRVADTRVWPRMFEDGEFWDMAYTTRNAALSPFDSGNALAELDPSNPDERVGMRHDAWLASSEPLWRPDNTADTWPQITNLRTGYRYITQQNNPGALGDWVADDAKFVDLARWFEDDQNGQGNPGADLTDFSDPITGFNNDFRLGLDQQIYMRQMDQMNDPGDEEFTPLDERAWVDTDGDLRPDARWQQLEVLGNNAGLIWVTAARIIDASALANYNAGLEFSYATPGTLPPRASDGRTPADIDVWGLLDLADERMQTIANDTRVRGNGTLAGYRQHLQDSLLVPDAIAQMTTLDPTYPNVENLTTYLGVWAPDSPQTLTADQRANYWRYVASDPLEPAASKGASHKMQDLIDLCAFWGTNHRSIYSTIEQDIDLQFPPMSNAGPNAVKGALRANEDPSYFRSLTENRPRLESIKADTRRLLTPYSGTGRFSPVPVINNSPANGSNEFDALFSLIKPDANRPQVDDAETIFASFMWALAPLATDEPLMRPFTRAEVTGTDYDLDIYHYGGGTTAPVGPARWVVAEDMSLEVGATYAVRTALAMTANLMDCGDTNKNPTVLRFFPRMNATERAFTDIAGTPAIELSDRLPQGNIRPTALAYPTTPITLNVETAVGTRVTPSDIPTTGNIADQMGALRKGITVVGLERQPFLREAFSAAFYSDMAEVTDEDFGDENGIISANGPADHTGYLFAVELANPWDTEINIDNYEVVLPASPQEINAATLNGLRFVAPDLNIDPGGVVVLVATNLEGDLRDAALDAMPEPIAQVAVAEFADVLNAPTGERIIFRQHAQANSGRLPVLLTYPIGATTAGTEFAVVDIMRPEAPASTDEGFPRALMQDVGVTEADSMVFLFDTGTIEADDDSLGAPDSRLPLDAGDVTGRLMICSSYSRPGGQPAGASGTSGSFPAYCLELNKGDNNLMGASRWRDFNASYTTTKTAQWGWNIASAVPGEAAVYQNQLGGGNAPELLVPMSWTDPDNTGLPLSVYSDLGENTKYADTDAALLNEIPPFQLYCRDGVDAFPTPASVAQVSTFAHVCLNHELNNLANWKTVSEQLTLNRFYNTGSIGGTLNPYMGTLDVSRFILNDTTAMTGAVANLPDPLAVPLATRVFDCFETLSSSSSTGLNQGQVNLNTAPVEVLAHLPFIWPRMQIADGGTTPPLTQLNQFDASAISSAPRLDYLTRYRASDFTDVISPAAGSTPDTLTMIQPLRVATGTGVDFRTPGFVSMGEVSILDQWTAGQPNANTGTQLFQSLGADMQPANAHPFDITTEPTGFAPWVPNARTTNPTDDIEEKLALFRGMVNCASTRSDVFLAWFVVRGYDPDLIESIEVPGGGGNAAEALNDERFAPTYESRWLCLFDRSNMRRPTDRPRLLMYVELPNARP